MLKTTLLLLLMGIAPEVGSGDGKTPPSPRSADRWLAVETLTPHDELRVEMVSGEIRRGRFLNATGELLSLMQNGTPVSCEREKIRNVYRLAPRSRRKHVVTGAVVGAALGLCGGLISEAPSGTSRAGMVTGAIVVEGGLGALVGFGVAGRGEFVLIYHAAP